MNDVHKQILSAPEKLLLAAFELEETGKRPFSAEDLVVAAWKNFPDTFGLAGYRDASNDLSYPDSNRVFAEIMGSKPIRKRGLLVKVGSKMYQLTEAGRDQARILQNRKGTTSIEKASLSREIEKGLKRLFASKAAEKIKNNRYEDLTFYDACAFWRISPRSSAIELEGRISLLLNIIESSRKVIQGKMATFEHGGQPFGSSDLDFLLQVHQRLSEKFQEEMKVIQKRTDERA